MSQLNTNSRYLSKGLTDYTAELARTLPHPLEVGMAIADDSNDNYLIMVIMITTAYILSSTVTTAAVKLFTVDMKQHPLIIVITARAVK
jgi:hypothetical protein